jgi:hypothetical protein
MEQARMKNKEPAGNKESSTYGHYIGKALYFFRQLGF